MTFRTLMRIPVLALFPLASLPMAAPAQESTLEARLSAVVARPGGLTAEEVARRAQETSFDVRARLAELEDAAWAVDQAIVGYYPRLTLAGRYQRLSPIGQPLLGNLLVAPLAGPGVVPPGTPLVNVPFSFPVFLNVWTLQATMSFPLSDYILRITQNHAAAAKSEKAAGLSARAARLKVATDGRVAYYTWARARLQVLVAEQAVVQAQGHRRDVARAVEVGTASRADLLRIESQVAAAELLLERARDLTALLEEQVRIAMHDPKRQAYEIGEDLRADLPPLPHADRLEALFDEAHDKRLEIKAIDATASGLKEQVKVVRASYYPRLDAVLDAQYVRPNPRIIPQRDQFDGTFAATFQLTWAPNDLAHAKTQVGRIEARLAQLEAQKGQVKDAMRAEVTQAYQTMREALVAIQTTARGLAAAEEAYRVRRELYRAGRGTVVEVTDAETELTRARLEAVNARVDLRIARARLWHAAGRDVEGGR
jgi:outer membrane protein TolC